jgi:hypothetical protein
VSRRVGADAGPHSGTRTTARRRAW